VTTGRVARAIALISAVAWSLAVPAAAIGHAVLLTASPAPGADLRAAPPVVRAGFSEPLNRPLSAMSLIGPGNRVVWSRTVAAGDRGLALAPRRRLGRGTYEVRWRTVSALDGHTLEGAYRFGVEVAGPAGVSSDQGDPLAGGGWLRVLLRAMMDAALIVFCGGVGCAALLDRGRPPGSWLLPAPTEPGDGERADSAWRRTVATGGVATIMAAASTLADAANAGHGLSAGGLHAFLLGDLSGAARLTTVAALIRRPAPAAGLAVAGLAALTVSGHGDAGHLRGLSIATDLAHLVAVSVWLGGIAHLAWTWLPGRGVDSGERRQAIAQVLPRFGRVALPAFAIVLVAGTGVAAIHLGSPPALWNTSYGRVLVVKIALVAAIALLSYAHAFRIRPALLSPDAGDSRLQPRGSAPPDSPRLESRLWRLLAGEPILGACVALAAALLIAYPPPGDTAPATPSPAGFAGFAAAGPLPATVSADQASVAAEAGPDIVAAWISRTPGQITAEIHTLSALEQPVELPVRVAGTLKRRPCGVGCTEVTLPSGAHGLVVTLTDQSRTYTVRLPLAAGPAFNRLAARLLRRVESSELRLRSAVVHETLAPGPVTPNVTTYELQAPDRLAYQLTRNGRPVADDVTIGPTEWTRSLGRGSWEKTEYGGGAEPFSTAAYLGWWMASAASPRLLGLHRLRGAEVADIATLTESAGVGPLWLRLRLDTTHGRLLSLQMITAEHFMTQSWGAFNTPQRIRRPRTGSG
jgi:copper transport protein